MNFWQQIECSINFLFWNVTLSCYFLYDSVMWTYNFYMNAECFNEDIPSCNHCNSLSCSLQKHKWKCPSEWNYVLIVTYISEPSFTCRHQHIFCILPSSMYTYSPMHWPHLFFPILGVWLMLQKKDFFLWATCANDHRADRRSKD